MKRAAVSVSVAFLVGAGFGYWLAPGPESPARAARSSLPLPSGSDETVADDSGSTVEIPTGKGVIQGRVLDEYGSPMADTLIVAVPQRTRAGEQRREAGALPWQEAQLRSAVDALHWYERTRRTARTDADGRYALTGLGVVPHDLRAYREGYQLRRADGAPRGDVTPDATIDFAGERRVLVGVQVRMPAGRRLENVWVTARGPESTGSRQWSPASPWLELRPGTYELQAKAGARQEYSSEKRTVRVEGDDPPQPVELQLREVRGLRVQLTLPAGFTARQLILQYVRFEGADPPGLAALRASRQSASANDDRVVWIPDLDAGRYLVGVHHGSYAFTASAITEVGEGTTNLTIDVSRPDPAECFTVRALRPDGRVERHASVDVELRTEEAGVGGGGVTLWGPDGTMYCAYPEWDPARHGELPAGATCAATVGVKDLGRRTVEFRREPGLAFDVRFAAPATLRVSIADYAASEHRETLRVTLHQRGTGPVAWWQPPTPEGTREFGPLQPGPYQVVLDKAAGKLEHWPVVSRDLDVTSGLNELALEIPRLYTLEVEVASAQPGLTVTLGGEERGRFSLRRGVPADGVVRFPDLAAGTYYLYCKEQRHTVTVPAQGRLTLR